MNLYETLGVPGGFEPRMRPLSLTGRLKNQRHGWKKQKGVTKIGPNTPRPRGLREKLNDPWRAFSEHLSVRVVEG